MKSVLILSYSSPYFPAFGLNTDQNNSEYGHILRSKIHAIFLKFLTLIINNRVTSDIHSLQANVQLLFPVTISENYSFSDVLRRDNKGAVTQNELTKIINYSLLLKWLINQNENNYQNQYLIIFIRLVPRPLHTFFQLK